ncbi:32778_t:CDS:1, partial [Racocetra persica]
GKDIVLQDEPTKTKLSRQARIYKNKKFRSEQEQIKMFYSSNNNIFPVIDDITFDPS